MVGFTKAPHIWSVSHDLAKQQRKEQGLTINIGRQVALLDGRIENLPRRATSIRGIKSIEANIVETAVVRMRQGRMYSNRTAWTDETI